MIKLNFKYNNGNEKISTQHKTEKEFTTIEWHIEKMCDFLVAVGFSKYTIQRYIPYDGELYTIEDWKEGLKED